MANSENKGLSIALTIFQTQLDLDIFKYALWLGSWKADWAVFDDFFFVVDTRAGVEPGLLG